MWICNSKSRVQAGWKTATISSGYRNYQQGTIIHLFHISGTVARTKIVKK